MILVGHPPLLRRSGRELDIAIIAQPVEIGLGGQVEPVVEGRVEVQAVLLDLARVAVGGVVGVGHARVRARIGESQVAGLLRIALVIAGDRAEPDVFGGHVEPFAGQAQPVEFAVLAVAVATRR